MREQQEKQKQLEAERRKKESQRHRGKEEGEEEKLKEDEINADKLERVCSIRSSIYKHSPFRSSVKNRWMKPCDSYNLLKNSLWILSKLIL